jgi:hypothetical protein
MGNRVPKGLDTSFGAQKGRKSLLSSRDHTLLERKKRQDERNEKRQNRGRW